MLERTLTPLVALTIAVSSACGAHAPAPHSFRYAELVREPETGRHIFDHPIILEFVPGDRLPIELGFKDALFALDPTSPSLALVAKEHCYVRIDEHGIRTSRDLDKFDQKPAAPGSFFFGFAHRDTGPRLSVQVQTPRREPR
jgi:hypothetical protein